VDGVMAAYCEGDLDAMLNMMPEKMEDMFSDIPGQRDDMEAQLEEMISERNADYGMGWTVTYYIDEEEKMKIRILSVIPARAAIFRGVRLSRIY